MSYRIELSARAERDLEQILGWIHERSPPGASTWFSRWQEVIAELASHPLRFSLAPENNDHDVEIRNVIFSTRRGKKYRAVFVVREDVVFIAHLRGPGQDLVRPQDFDLECGPAC